MSKDYGEPWRILMNTNYNGDIIHEDTIYEIVDRDGKTIVETDCGCYSPDKETAERIVQCVNERAGKE